MLTNADIARALHDLADALDLSDRRDARYRARAIRAGARAIDALVDPAVELLARGELTNVKGIGEGIARRVEELVATGKIADVEKMRQGAQKGLFEIARVDGIGPRTAQKLYGELGIATLDELEAAARAGALRSLSGWGEKKEQKVLAGIARARTQTGRVRLSRAEKEVLPVVERVKGLAGVAGAHIVGPLRRRVDVVTSEDVLIVVTDAEAGGRALASALESAAITDVITRDATSASARTRLGALLNVHVVPAEGEGTALFLLTGSEAHIAAAMRLGTIPRSCAREEDVYAAVGLPLIPPELREGRGEVEAALRGELPRLITLEDMRGDLHMHTTETDGRATLDEMVAQALEMGRQYIAITDHSENLKMVGGLDAGRLRAQAAEIAAVNERLGGKLRVLRGIEADILVDGTIDLGPEVLGELDWVIGSVHSHMGLPREEQTRRIVAAIESGDIDVVGHPTGRILEHRPPYDVDMEAIVEAAARTGVALEVNAYPDRLDLNDEHAKLARDRGAFLVIDTDSHATSHLYAMEHGVEQARRAWLEPRHVLNTRPVEELLAHRAERRARRRG